MLSSSAISVKRPWKSRRASSRLCRPAPPHKSTKKPSKVRCSGRLQIPDWIAFSGQLHLLRNNYDNHVVNDTIHYTPAYSIWICHSQFLL